MLSTQDKLTRVGLSDGIGKGSLFSEVYTLIIMMLLNKRNMNL